MREIISVVVNDKDERQRFARSFALLGLKPSIRIAEQWEKDEQGGYRIPYVRTQSNTYEGEKSVARLMVDIEDHPDSYGPRIDPNPSQCDDPRLQAFYDQWWRLNSVSFAIQPADKDQVVKLYIERCLDLPAEVAEGFCAGSDAYCATIGERQSGRVEFEPDLITFWIGVMRVFPLDFKDRDIGFLASQGPNLVREFLSYLSSTWSSPALEHLWTNAAVWK